MKLLAVVALFFANPLFAMSKPPIESSGPVLREDFEGKSLDSLKTDTLPGSYSYSLSTLQARNGSQSLRVELRPEDKGTKAQQAEVVDTYKAQVGMKTWYHVSLFVPQDINLSSQSSCALAQWKGGVFASNPALPAPLSLNIDGQGTFTVKAGFFPSTKSPSDYSLQDIYTEHNFNKQEWNDFLFEVYWSPRADGFVNVWKNGELITSYQGPVGFDARHKEDQGPSLYLGMKCDQAPLSKLVIYYDMYRRAPTYSDIRIKE